MFNPARNFVITSNKQLFCSCSVCLKVLSIDRSSGEDIAVYYCHLLGQPVSGRAEPHNISTGSKVASGDIPGCNAPDHN